MKVSSVCLVIAVAACGATPAPVPREPAPSGPEPPPVVELDVPAPAPPRPERPTREELILSRPTFVRRGSEEIVVAESQFWEPCVRHYVAAQSEVARRALTSLFASYATVCERDGRIELQLTRGVDGRERRGKSDVGFVGSLSAKRIDLSLRVAYCRQPPPIADRIVIASDDARWSSTQLAFERDEQNCAVAELPITRTLRRVLRAATDATDTVVRFEGQRGEDLVVTEDMKQDLRLMLDALDALEP